MRLRLLALALPALLLAGCGGGDEESAAPAPPAESVAAREATPEDLAIMVLPQDELGPLAAGLELDADSGVQDNSEDAEDSIDPDDTAETVQAEGRVTGYELAYSGSEVFQIETGVSLYVNADAAAVALDKRVADLERFEGREPVPGITVESVDRFAVEGVGDEAIGVRAEISFSGVTLVGTTIGFRSSTVIGNANVVAADDTDRNANVEELARALAARIDGVLSGRIQEEPVPLTAEPPPAPPPATTGAAARPPPGGPDLAAMVLALEDLPEGVTVAREGYVEPEDVLAAYEREFDVLSAAFGDSSLIGLENDVELYGSESAARVTVAAISAVVKSEGSEDFLREEFAQGAGFEASDIAVELVPAEGIGDQASIVNATFETPAGIFDAYFMFLRVGAAVAQIYAVGATGSVSFDDVRPLAERATERMATALTGS